MWNLAISGSDDNGRIKFKLNKFFAHFIFAGKISKEIIYVSWHMSNRELDDIADLSVVALSTELLDAINAKKSLDCFITNFECFAFSYPIEKELFEFKH